MTNLPSSPKPQPSAEDLAQKARIVRMLREMTEENTDHNLHRVRRLIDMALQRRVPQELLEHLSYLGRDWYKLADNGPPRPQLRVIEGSLTGSTPSLPAPKRKPRSRKQ